jgi:hypothetical protein
MSTKFPTKPNRSGIVVLTVFAGDVGSDVPGRAWAQALGSGWASEGLGSRNPKPDPELRAGPGLGLVGLKPGLASQKGNPEMVG